MLKVIDLKKDCKQLYNPSARIVTEIDVPRMNFLMVDGKGDPNKSPDFQAAIESLYSLSYTIKFCLKKNYGRDYRVMPLEGLWWTDNKAEPFDIRHKKNWKWTLMIMQPEFVTENAIEESIEQLKKKKESVSTAKIRLAQFAEGLSVQIMHVGPFAAEGPTIAKLHQYINKAGHTLRGKHHEIYLSDFRRVAPEKMKTVLRQPMKRHSGGNHE